jgi:hypothetical protein
MVWASKAATNSKYYTTITVVCLNWHYDSQHNGSVVMLGVANKLFVLIVILHNVVAPLGLTCKHYKKPSGHKHNIFLQKLFWVKS